jgi:hypothetical protein
MNLTSKIKGLFFLTALIPLIFLSHGFAEESDYIDRSAYEKTTQAAVQFLHDNHNDNAGIDECSICHHLYEDGALMEGESSEDMPCADCHSPKRFNKGVTLTTAFHKNCKGCHLKEKTGPILCGECHKKN